MADLALKRAGRGEVDESIDQSPSFPASVDIDAAAAVRLDANGKWALASGADAAGSTHVHVAAKKVRAGDSVTGIRNGVIDAYDVSALAFNAPIYLSNTPGKLGTTAGTVAVIIGRVVPGWAVPLGNAPDKLIKIDAPL